MLGMLAFGKLKKGFAEELGWRQRASGYFVWQSWAGKTFGTRQKEDVLSAAGVLGSWPGSMPASHPAGAGGDGAHRPAGGTGLPDRHRSPRQEADSRRGASPAGPAPSHRRGHGPPGLGKDRGHRPLSRATYAGYRRDQHGAGVPVKRPAPGSAGRIDPRPPAGGAYPLCAGAGQGGNILPPPGSAPLAGPVRPV